MQAKICLSERKETLDNRSLTLGHILIFISKISLSVQFIHFAFPAYNKHIQQTLFIRAPL